MTRTHENRFVDHWPGIKGSFLRKLFIPNLSYSDYKASGELIQTQTQFSRFSYRLGPHFSYDTAPSRAAGKRANPTRLAHRGVNPGFSRPNFRTPIGNGTTPEPRSSAET